MSWLSDLYEDSWLDDGLTWGFDKLDDVGESLGNTVGGVLDGATNWFNDNTDNIMSNLVDKWFGNDSDSEQETTNTTTKDNTILWIGGGLALVVIVVLVMTMQKK